MNEVMNPKAVDAGRGAGWITDGFGYFKANPLAWIGALFLFFVLAVVLSIIPLLSLVLNVLFPVVMGGFMLGCRAQDQGNPFRVKHLFAGFSHPGFSRLVILGVLFFVASIVLMVLVFIMMFTLMGGAGLLDQLQSGQIDTIIHNPQPILLAVLVGASLAMPLLMAEWFAPAVVVFQDQSPVDAMVASFRGCLVNVMPFTVYGVVGLLLMVIACIPLMLGYVILLPVLMASIYAAYKDIYE